MDTGIIFSLNEHRNNLQYNPFMPAVQKFFFFFFMKPLQSYEYHVTIVFKTNGFLDFVNCLVFFKKKSDNG